LLFGWNVASVLPSGFFATALRKKSELGVPPPPVFEVRMQNASNPAQKRKRGGQPGNSNRLIHGRYTKEQAVRREEICAYRRKGRALVILVDNVLKARKALRLKLAVRALAAKSANACMQRPSPRRKTQQISVAQLHQPLSCHGPPGVGRLGEARSLFVRSACHLRPRSSNINWVAHTRWAMTAERVKRTPHRLIMVCAHAA
jgi:hypothetical protein